MMYAKIAIRVPQGWAEQERPVNVAQAHALQAAKNILIQQHGYPGIYTAAAMHDEIVMSFGGDNLAELNDAGLIHAANTPQA